MLNIIAHLFYEEDSFFVFLLVTIILGGGAAFLSGRAIALTWRPWWQVAAYMLVLGGVVRFFHMALFEGHLLTLHYYVVDTAFCLMFGFLGLPDDPGRADGRAIWLAVPARRTDQLGEKKARAKRRSPQIRLTFRPLCR